MLVGAGVAAAATGTSAATAAAAAATAAADVPLGSVWSVCDEDFEELAPPSEPELESESVESDAAWPLSLAGPLVDWP